MRIRGGSGLGDAIYIRPVVDHFVRAGEAVTALSNFFPVFDGSGAAVEPFTRDRVTVVAHYVSGKSRVGTTQWQDVCISAGVGEIPFRVDWKVQNRPLIDGVKERARGRPIVLVHGGRQPMGRSDGFGIELLPAKRAFDAVLDALRDCYTVQIGKAPQLYSMAAASNLNGSTSVSDLLDLAQACDGVVAQCSFAIPLAEIFDKPLLAIWSARAASSKLEFIRLTTPIKVLSKRTSRFIMDDRRDGDVKLAAGAWKDSEVMTCAS